MRLKDRIALVTGAARGIGLACARRFADEGASVVLVDTDADGLARAVDHFLPERVLAHRADVSVKARCAEALDATLARFGRLDILLNNAGIVHAADFLALEEHDFDRVLAVNLKSCFLMGQLAARHMVERRRAGDRAGVIINMSSVNAVLAIADQVPYVVSKGGVNQLTRVMAVSLAPHGIRVNGIGPGTILTELARDAVLKSEAALERITSRTPLGRLGEPEEVAAVAAFLASDDASYLTGQTLYPDGGRLSLNYTMPPSS